ILRPLKTTLGKRRHYRSKSKDIFILSTNYGGNGSATTMTHDKGWSVIKIADQFVDCLNVVSHSVKLNITRAFPGSRRIKRYSQKAFSCQKINMTAHMRIVFGVQFTRQHQG